MMIRLDRGMGSGVSPIGGKAFTQVERQVATFQATGNVSALLGPITAAKTTPPDPNAWYNTAPTPIYMGPMTLGQKIAALPASTKIGVGLGLAAVVGLVIMRRRAA